MQLPNNGLPVTCAFNHVKSMPFELQKFDRRDAYDYFYVPVDCPELKKCNDGKCPLAHSKLEKIFHPIVYKTQACQMAKNKSCEYLQKCAFYHDVNDKGKAVSMWQAWEAHWRGWRLRIDEILRIHGKSDKEIRHKVEGILKIRKPKHVNVVGDVNCGTPLFSNVGGGDINMRNSTVPNEYNDFSLLGFSDFLYHSLGTTSGRDSFLSTSGTSDFDVKALGQTKNLDFDRWILNKNSDNTGGSMLNDNGVRREALVLNDYLNGIHMNDSKGDTLMRHNLTNLSDNSYDFMENSFTRKLRDLDLGKNSSGSTNSPLGGLFSSDFSTVASAFSRDYSVDSAELYRDNDFQSYQLPDFLSTGDEKSADLGYSFCSNNSGANNISLPLNSSLDGIFNFSSVEQPEQTVKERNISRSLLNTMINFLSESDNERQSRQKEYELSTDQDKLGAMKSNPSKSHVMDVLQQYLIPNSETQTAKTGIFENNKGMVDLRRLNTCEPVTALPGKQCERCVQYAKDNEDLKQQLKLVIKELCRWKRLCFSDDKDVSFALQQGNQYSTNESPACPPGDANGLYTSSNSFPTYPRDWNLKPEGLHLSDGACFNFPDWGEIYPLIEGTKLKDDNTL